MKPGLPLPVLGWVLAGIAFWLLVGVTFVR